MANEIATTSGTGQTLYAVLRNAGAQAWNTSSAAFETYTSANYAQYALALLEQGSTGFYVASFPAQITTAGRYSVDIRVRAGATPAAGDAVLAAGSLRWSGSAEVDVVANNDKAGYTSTVAGYAGGQDPASLLLSTPANKLLTTSSGQVQHDLTQPVPTSNTAQTVGDALNGARAQALGKWVLSGTTLTLYAADGTTAVRQFVLDSATNPTSRT